MKVDPYILHGPKHFGFGRESPSPQGHWGACPAPTGHTTIGGALGRCIVYCIVSIHWAFMCPCREHGSSYLPEPIFFVRGLGLLAPYPSPCSLNFFRAFSSLKGFLWVYFGGFFKSILFGSISSLPSLYDINP